MKILFMLLLSFGSVSANAQKWKEHYVASTGDTIKKGTVLVVNEGKPITHIFVDPDYPQNLKERFKIYLTSSVPGSKCQVSEISRIKDGKGWVYTAHFKYRNARMGNNGVAEYSVLIEDALKSGEISIIN